MEHPHPERLALASDFRRALGCDFRGVTGTADDPRCRAGALAWGMPSEMADARETAFSRPDAQST